MTIYLKYRKSFDFYLGTLLVNLQSGCIIDSDAKKEKKNKKKHVSGSQKVDYA